MAGDISPGLDGDDSDGEYEYWGEASSDRYMSPDRAEGCCEGVVPWLYLHIRHTAPAAQNACGSRASEGGAGGIPKHTQQGAVARLLILLISV
jgi:hypothetical protein